MRNIILSAEENDPNEVILADKYSKVEETSPRSLV